MQRNATSKLWAVLVFVGLVAATSHCALASYASVLAAKEHACCAAKVPPVECNDCCDQLSATLPTDGGTLLIPALTAVLPEVAVVRLEASLTAVQPFIAESPPFFIHCVLGTSLNSLAPPLFV